MRVRENAAVVVGLLSLACGRVAGIDDYEPEASNWRCLGRTTPATAGPGRFKLSITARMFGDAQMGLPDATATLCRKIDAHCSDHDDERTTDGNGNVTFDVPAAFGGFVRVTKADDTLPPEQRIMPSFYYVSPNMNSDQDVVVQMTSVAMRNAAMALVGVAFREDRGLMLVNALDCNNAAARGVFFETEAADSETEKFFVRNGLPDRAATLTDVTGFGGFLNAVPGITSVTARIGETDRVIGTLGITVTADALTQTRFVPSGSPP
jgi:hypothetical protein